MPAYTLELIAHDGSSLGELPDAQLEDVSWANSNSADINFSMLQTDARVSDIQLRLHEVRLFIEGWPDPLSVPWQGPVLNDKQDDTRVAFSGSSLECYFARRFIDFSSLTYDDLVDGYEQTEIAWGLVQYAQGIPVRDYTINNVNKRLRITADALPVTKKRLRRYEREDHLNIMEALQEFPTLVDFNTGAPNGFDWAVLPFTDGRRVWTPFSPQRGSRKPDLTLEYGRNILSFSVAESMVNFASRTICTGGNNGDIKIENEWNDAAASAMYGEDMAITSDSTQMDPAELGAKARAYTLARNHPIVDPDLQAVRAPVELLGVLQPGDTVPVSIHKGRTNIEADFRIQSIKWAVRPNNLVLTFYPSLAGG